MNKSIRKVMIATVGTGKTGTDIAKMLLFTIENSNPDLTYFIVSEKTRDATIPKFVELNVNSYKYKLEVLNDEDDFTEVFKQVSTLITNICKEYQLLSDNITVDFTSGTKAMSSGLVLAAVATKVKEVKYISGKRDDTGRVFEGSESPKSLNTTALLAEQEIIKIISLFNTGQFTAVIKLCTEIEERIKVPIIYNKVKLLRLLSEVYRYWENLNYKLAAEGLKKLLQELEQEIKIHKDLYKRLQKTSNHLHNIAGNTKHNKFILRDIIASAKRRIKENKYDDATARLYRAVEYIAQLKLSEDYEIHDTGKIPVDKIPEEYIKNRRDKAKNGFMILGLRDSYALLKALDEKLGCDFIEDNQNKNSKIRTHLHNRNKSILAHGINSISQENAESFFEWILGFAEKIDKNLSEELNKIQFYTFN